MKHKKTDWVFECNKCGKILFVDKKEMNKMRDLEDCPECGEETPIFIFQREGNYEEEYGNEQPNND